MVTRRVNHPHASKSRGAPARTPEAREDELIAKAVDLAERQIEDGSVSAQVLSHYLKLGSSREKLEQERMAQEVKLLKAKEEMMESAKKVEEMYGQALNAMRAYSGQEPLANDDDYD